MLNLHVMKQHTAVSKLDVSSTRTKQLHGAFRSQGGPQNVLWSPGHTDVDHQHCLASSHISLGV